MGKIRANELEAEVVAEVGEHVVLERLFAGSSIFFASATC